MFSRLRKKSYWNEVGNIDGFHQAVERLGSKTNDLDTDTQYLNSRSVWGDLAELTNISNKSDYEARKWLYNAWKEDRRQVRSSFYATKKIHQSGESAATGAIRFDENIESCQPQTNEQVCSALHFSGYRHIVLCRREDHCQSTVICHFSTREKTEALRKTFLRCW